MAVIKQEYINENITRHDLLPLSFLKKSAYTGSKGKLRYRLKKEEIGEEEQKTAVLRCWTWLTPFSFDHTPEEEMQVKDFSFTNDGIDDCIVYLNACLNGGKT